MVAHESQSLFRIINRKLFAKLKFELVLPDRGSFLFSFTFSFFHIHFQKHTCILLSFLIFYISVTYFLFYFFFIIKFNFKTDVNTHVFFLKNLKATFTYFFSL